MSLFFSSNLRTFEIIGSNTKKEKKNTTMRVIRKCQNSRRTVKRIDKRKSQKTTLSFFKNWQRGAEEDSIVTHEGDPFS